MFRPKALARTCAPILFVVGSVLAAGCGDPVLAPLGGACQKNTDCLDGVCHRGACSLKNPHGQDEQCSQAAECRSLVCTSGLCERGQGAEGDSCLFDEACDSGSCESELCAAPICGDGIRNLGEECDRQLGTDDTCAANGFQAGTLSCGSDCRFDTSECVKHEWAEVPAGTFTMGSPPSEPGREAGETQHQVTLTHDFEMMTREVTQGEFQRLRRHNPAQFAGQDPCKGADCPVEGVDWDNAAAYCNELSEAQGITPCYACEGTGATVFCSTGPQFGAANIYNCPGYRLPTEAEWEFAYRAGSETAYYGNLSPDAIGWHSGNSADSPHPVAKKKANAHGLYDLAGNVWEWCHDDWMPDLGADPATNPVSVGNPSARVTRGGSWHFPPNAMRAASRLQSAPSNIYYDIGFRCVRSL